MNLKVKNTGATYLGLQAEVIVKLDHKPLIRFYRREIIVDTADLVFSRSFACAA